jgi:hypothetical protein
MPTPPSVLALRAQPARLLLKRVVAMLWKLTH